MAQAPPDPSINHQEPSIQTSATVEIQAGYESLLGYKVNNWAAGEAKAAKQIAHDFTVEQLSKAYQHYKAQSFWSDKRLTLSYLAKNMQDLFSNGAIHDDGARLPDGV